MFVALGIPNVGSKTAKILARSIIELAQTRHPEDSETLSHIFLSIFPTLTQESLESLRDIGAETARSILTFFTENRDEITSLFHELIFEDTARDIRTSGGKLLGKSFCVTGSFETLSRDQIHALIEQNGGEVRTSVTARLDYLIAGTSAGSKKIKAESLGIVILSLEDFYELLK